MGGRLSHCTGGSDKDHLQQKEAQKGKGEKERYNHLNADFQRRARREKKVSLEIKENK